MNIYNPNNCPEFKQLKNAIFLAGPCPREKEDFKNDWRKEAISLFEKYNFNGDIINPTNDNYDNDLEKQTLWEHKGLCYASAILFWIPRSEKHPALTTNIEFGEWFDKENVFVGFPDDSIKNDYIDVKLKQNNITRYKTLESIVKSICKRFKSKEKVFVTSDTHFSAERTRVLSYRPFKNVDEMDNQLISNWNKRITMNDVVVHLGDFGNPEIIHLLNFKKMYFLPGNYERDDKKFQKEVYFNDDRVQLLKEGEIVINGKKYIVKHEPFERPIEKVNKNEFYLFGHIHRLQMVKRNGINVGIDGNRFKPMSVSEIEFLRGGIEEHFDENVFQDSCQ